MSYLLNDQQKVNDIIFAHRNKAYGAYAIRSAYGNTILKSLSIMLFGFGSIIAMAFYLSNRNTEPGKNGGYVIHDSITTTIFDIKNDKEKTVEKVEKKLKPAQALKTADKGRVLITDSVKTEAKMVLNAEKDAVSQSTLTGEDGPDTRNNGNETGIKSNGIAAEEEVKEGYGVDSNPEYEGGLSALYRFVSSHLKYPAIAAEVGKEGTVFVKFVVDEKGRVGNLTLLNSTGYGLDEEAIRVVAMIPNFKTPAKIKGKAVKVYYQLPIKFRFH